MITTSYMLLVRAYVPMLARATIIGTSTEFGARQIRAICFAMETPMTPIKIFANRYPRKIA